MLPLQFDCLLLQFYYCYKIVDYFYTHYRVRESKLYVPRNLCDEWKVTIKEKKKKKKNERKIQSLHIHTQRLYSRQCYFPIVIAMDVHVEINAKNEKFFDLFITVMMTFFGISGKNVWHSVPMLKIHNAQSYHNNNCSNVFIWDGSNMAIISSLQNLFSQFFFLFFFLVC